MASEGLKATAAEMADAAERVGVSAERLARIKPALQHYVAEGKVAGIVTLAARHGRVIHCESLGWQDVAAQRPMQPNTIFRIYSMTKPIVSVALMLLLERGLCQLSNPVAKFLPQFGGQRVLHPDGTTEPAQPMTVHHLLTHMAGLSYGFYEDTPVDELYRRAELFGPNLTLAAMTAEIAKLPLVFQPGSGWRYSVATDVVGHLVEVLADLPLGEFLREEIFRPLGMEDTGYEVPEYNRGRLATLYGTTESGPLSILEEGHSSPHLQRVKNQRGGSGLVSTAADYVRFAQMCLNGGELNGVRVIGRKTLEFMRQNHVPASLFPLAIGEPMPGIGFGLGFSVTLDVAQTGIMGSVGNYGWSGAADTHYWVDPQEGLIGMILMQHVPSLSYPVRHDFKNMLYAALEA